VKSSGAGKRPVEPVSSSTMFEDLQRLFRESVAAFRSELDKREPEDEVAHLLGSMRRELVEARALIPRIEEDLKGARAELARERELLERTERRGKLANQINDGETVRIAEEFSAKHRERIGVLEQKVAARDAELALRKREADEMKRQYQEADANRMELVARLRRGLSHERIRTVADETAHSFSEWERMAEKMGSDSAYAEALRELDEDSAPPPPPPGPSPTDVEERLRELKRRMGKG
jgi:phage shock protein A